MGQTSAWRSGGARPSVEHRGGAGAWVVGSWLERGNPAEGAQIFKAIGDAWKKLYSNTSDFNDCFKQFWEGDDPATRFDPEGYSIYFCRRVVCESATPFREQKRTAPLVRCRGHAR